MRSAMALSLSFYFVLYLSFFADGLSSPTLYDAFWKWCLFTSKIKNKFPINIPFRGILTTLSNT